MSMRAVSARASLALGLIAALSFAACGGGGSGGGGDSGGGDATSPAETPAPEEPTEAPAAGGRGGGDIPVLANGTYTGGTAHLKVSGDKTLNVDLPLQTITSTTLDGFTLLTYSAGDGQANVALNVVVDPETGPAFSLSSAPVFTGGGRGEGCTFEFNRNDGSGVSGTFACSNLEGMSAEGAERPTVDIKGTFSADL